MKVILAIAVLFVTTAVAAAQSPPAPAAQRSDGRGATRSALAPAPIVIPQELSPPQEAYAAFPEESATSTPAAPSACQLRLAKIASFRALPILIGAGECGATDAVLIDAVTLADQSKVAIAPPATLRCPMAEEVAHWIREDIAPAALKLGAALRVVDDFDSYECRGRNRVRGAVLSEHGRANALDVRGFKLADGRNVGLTDVTVDKAWRNAIRAEVCARFSTVLGPGSDGAHEEHIHLDLAERRNNYKVCEWDVREPTVQAKAVPSAQPQASSEDAVAEDADNAAANENAAIPAALVPLPRPRPLALIGQDARRGPPHGGFDAARRITPQ